MKAMKIKNIKKKKITNLEYVEIDKGDEFGNPVGKYYAEFSFTLDEMPASFEVSKNARGFGTEPYNCKGISEADAKKVIRTFKKRKKSDDPEIDETEFKI